MSKLQVFNYDTFHVWSCVLQKKLGQRIPHIFSLGGSIYTEYNEHTNTNTSVSRFKANFMFSWVFQSTQLSSDIWKTTFPCLPNSFPCVYERHQCSGAGGTAQWLGTVAVLPEPLDLAPRTISDGSQLPGPQFSEMGHMVTQTNVGTYT